MSNDRPTAKVGVGYDVVCPGCKGVFHETGELFRSDQTSSGAMFSWKPKYGPKGFNWSGFPFNTSMRSGSLECPQCGALYCGGGVKVTVRAQQNLDFRQMLKDVKPIVKASGTVESPPEVSASVNDANVCADCGKVFKTKAGLLSHSRSKHGNDG